MNKKKKEIDPEKLWQTACWSDQIWQTAYLIEDETKREDLREIALKAYGQELEFLWKRSSFFWLFTAAALGGFVTLKEEFPLLALSISCFGFIAAISWSLLNRGSKYWYESWEQKVQLDPVLMWWFEPVKLQPKKGKWLAGRRFSPSKLAIGISDYVTLFWLGALIIQAIILLAKNLDIFKWFLQNGESIIGVCLIGFTLLYTFYLICSTAGEGVLETLLEDSPPRCKQLVCFLRSRFSTRKNL